MCDHKTIEILIEKLDKFNKDQAPEIVDRIITCGEAAIQPLLTAFFRGEKTSEKEYILQALAALIDETALTQELLRYLDRLWGFTRYYSLQYLFETGNETVRKRLVPPMIADIGGHYYCHTFALDTLPKYGEVAIDQIISALMEQCKHQNENHDGRFTGLIFILGHIDDERVIAPLITALYSTRNKEIYESLIWAFERLGRKVIPALLRVIRDHEASLAIKRCAVNSLYGIPDKQSVNDLITLLKHEEHDLRRAAISALGKVRDSRATSHLIHIIQTDQNDFVRSAAATALGDVRDEQAIQPLIEAMKADPYPETRRLAAFALRHYRGAEVVEALVETLHDDEIIVPIWARYALDQMGREARSMLQKVHAQRPDIIDRAYNTWPWELVNSCRQIKELQAEQLGENNEHVSAKEFYADRAHDCPICGKSASELAWVFVSTPAETWKKLVGRAGWMIICDDCHVQVDFFLEAMN